MSGVKPPSRARRRRIRIGVELAVLALVLGLVLFDRVDGYIWKARLTPDWPSPKAPHVLLITLDTTRFDRIGAVINGQRLTPHLDTLAGESIVFNNAHTQVPVTGPAHTSILSGMDVRQHQVVENGVGINVKDTLATAFRKAGYETLAAVSSFVLDSRFGFARGFNHYDDQMTNAHSGGGFSAAAEVDCFERSATETTFAAVKLWERMLPASKPVFMWVHYYDPHESWSPPVPWSLRFSNGYDGEVAYMDHQIGRLLDYLKARGIFENTVVAVVSDHGESLGEHGILGHGRDLYEPATKAVMMFKPVGGNDDIGPIETPVMTKQTAATLLALAGLPVTLPGFDLLTGLGERPVGPAYMESWLPRTRDGQGVLRAAWSPPWKMVVQGRGGDGRQWLFNLKRDPGEHVNLVNAQTPSVREAVTKLEQFLGASTKAATPHDVDMTDEIRAKLRALGYIR